MSHHDNDSMTLNLASTMKGWSERNHATYIFIYSILQHTACSIQHTVYKSNGAAVDHYRIEYQYQSRPYKYVKYLVTSYLCDWNGHTWHPAKFTSEYIFYSFAPVHPATRNFPRSARGCFAPGQPFLSCPWPHLTKINVICHLHTGCFWNTWRPSIHTIS